MLDTDNVTTAFSVPTNMADNTVSSASNRETTGDIDPLMKRPFLRYRVYTVAVR
jgi:hypothetical protein